MTVIADAKKRVVLPVVKPGDRFDVQVAGEGKVILTKLEPVRGRKAFVRFEKRGRFTVGVSNQPVSLEAIKEAIAEFP